jgi:hypothetical protein
MNLLIAGVGPVKITDGLTLLIAGVGPVTAPGAGTFISYARAWQFNEVRQAYVTTSAFKNAVLAELRGAAVWARWTPGTLPFSGSSNMQIDVTAIPWTLPLRTGGQKLL